MWPSPTYVEGHCEAKEEEADTAKQAEYNDGLPVVADVLRKLVNDGGKRALRHWELHRAK